MPEQLVLCGIIHGPHGVNGLLKVESLSDNPRRFSVGSSFQVTRPAQAPRELTIQSATPHKNRLLVQFVGIDSKEAAQPWLGAELWAEADNTPPAQGGYYHYQLIGLKVMQDGQDIGVISEILSRPANDVYVIKTTAGEEIWLPALKSVVRKIDIAHGIMEVELPPGL